MKTCPKCSPTQPLPDDRFHPSNRRDGLRTYCKVCDADLRAASSEYTKRYNKEYYRTNKDRLAAASAQYYEEHKEEIDQYGRDYYREVRRGPRLEADILSRTKARAKKAGIPFSITLEDIVIPSVCPVLGIEITCNSTCKKGPHHGSPSIDRIEPCKGYVKGNVRIISNRANTLKCNGTIEEFEKVLADLRGLRPQTE